MVSEGYANFLRVAARTPDFLELFTVDLEKMTATFKLDPARVYFPADVLKSAAAYEEGFERLMTALPRLAAGWQREGARVAANEQEGLSDEVLTEMSADMDPDAPEGSVYFASATKGRTSVRYIGATHIGFDLLTLDIVEGNNQIPATPLVRLRPFGYKFALYPVASAKSSPDNKEEVRCAIKHYLDVMCCSTLSGLNMEVMGRTPVPHPDGPLTYGIIEKVMDYASLSGGRDNLDCAKLRNSFDTTERWRSTRTSTAPWTCPTDQELRDIVAGRKYASWTADHQPPLMGGLAQLMTPAAVRRHGAMPVGGLAALGKKGSSSTKKGSSSAKK